MILKNLDFIVKEVPSKSKKTKKTNIKKEQAKKTRKLFIYRAFGVYQIHRLYGDMVFTDKLFDIGENPIYPYELFGKSKIMRQIHIRKHGVLLEFEDYDEKFVSSVEFIKTRMMTLGNKDAKDFCKVLDEFQEYFLRKKSPPTELKYEAKLQSTFALVDEIFEKHKEDVVALRGSKFIAPNDFRMRFLGFNSKILEWINEEKNYFSEDFLSDCMRIFPMKSHFDFFEIMKVMIGKSKTLPKKIFNTIFGEIDLKVAVNVAIFPKNSECFHYFVHCERRFRSNFSGKIEIFIFKKEIAK